ncbi:glycerophosphodiester phosphodiesterase [Jeotgalibacillus sp. S-D1]|uniref:glycerophosphodiester phosphodiesterase family protein n=1 Tax=Jeotgalibacillus sp. S-D1 TaxID=2552189 RepID=UPI00105A9515|nr:glycerophosphodiester phosphodiesterase family protein [Jeotgalibacillus sp. S-D1]TDL30854.1 glycerophosphodiester phosphodiesterase [Jeotgalibacillus sp. S-D1]
MKRKKWKTPVLILLIFILFIFVNNTSLLVETNNSPFLLAHRGVGQTFSMDGIEGDTCTAERIFEPDHTYLENTIPSMEAAFEAGADMVEFDIRPTKDGQFAVFHDWTLDCRTDAVGEPVEYTMDELRKMDIGYGYTADNGETFPFRGKGIGLMPSLEEVLEHFPDEQFLVHIKSNEKWEGKQLAEFLASRYENELSRIAVYGGDEPISELKSIIPEIRVMSLAVMKDCLLPYLAVGWTGHMPSSCENTQLHIPEKFVSYMWGWPGKFIQRMDKENTRVIVVAGSGKWSEGFDSVEDINRLPEDYSGWIWTNRIDLISKHR